MHHAARDSTRSGIAVTGCTATFKGLQIIPTGSASGQAKPNTSAYLLFEAGKRPSREDILARSSASSSGFSVSYDPVSEGSNISNVWLELLTDGLTFDISGLNPTAGLAINHVVQSVGFDSVPDPHACEAVCITTGPHLGSGWTMLPILRSLAGLASELTGLEGCIGLYWPAAACLSAPAFIRSSVTRWLDGGVFPGLGLASLILLPDGTLQSKGLALFTGQEMQVAPDLGADRTERSKLALRLLDEFVTEAPVTRTVELAGPDGSRLTLRPIERGRIVRVERV